MKKEIEFKKYDSSIGIQLKWNNNFAIEVKNEENSVIIKANVEGLLSLASHLLCLSQDAVTNGTHIHLDKFNSLEENSCDLVIEREDNM